MGRKKMKGYERDYSNIEKYTPKKREYLPIYLNGHPDIMCKYLKIKKDRHSGITLFECTNQELLDGKVSMILSCEGCEYKAHKRKYTSKRKNVKRTEIEEV